MPHANVDGVRLFYQDTGAGAPLLFHHAHTASHESWSAVVERMRDRHRCVVMDARGAGDSDHSADGYTVEQMARDVLAVADAAGLETFTYVGHSMGGVIGFELGLEHAARLEKLVLVCPGPADGMQVPADAREQSRRQWTHRDRDAMIRDRNAMIARYSAMADTARGVDRALSVSPGHFDGCFAAVCSSRRGDRLAEIRTPTLVVAGAADALLHANLHDFVRLRHATLHVFSRVGHALPREVPEALADVLADFVEHGVVTATTLRERAITASGRTAARSRS